MQGLAQPVNARRIARKTTVHARLAGSLRGDLTEVAMKLHEALHRSDITVWTDANSEVYFDAPEKSPLVDTQWLAGTYGVGASAGDIEADLIALRRECIPATIILD